MSTKPYSLTGKTIEEIRQQANSLLDELWRQVDGLKGVHGEFVSHSNLSDLGNDSHTQYFKVDGSRPLTGDLDFGNKQAKNIVLENTKGIPVGVVKGQEWFDETDKTSYFFDGTNKIAKTSVSDGSGSSLSGVGTPVDISTANATGSATTINRSDHVHKHPDIASDLHSVYLLAAGSRGLSADWDAGAHDIKALSFSVGSNKLTTSEFGNLDGQDQAVKTTSTPVFKEMIQTASGTISRDGNGYISSVAKTGGRTLTVTRDGNNYISSIADGTRTWSFTRNGSNQITSWAVA